MNDVKLTDFTAQELQDLLSEVVNGIDTWTGPDYETKYNNLSLWRTQILNAISTVKMRETTQAN